MTDTEITRTEPARELGFDQSDVPVGKANETPNVSPTVESVETACEDSTANGR